jgi:hypothetical protein
MFRVVSCVVLVPRVPQPWSLCLALLNSVLFLHDSLLDRSLDGEVVDLEDAVAGVAMSREAPLLRKLAEQPQLAAAADIGRKALSSVSVVASGISTCVCVSCVSAASCSRGPAICVLLSACT